MWAALPGLLSFLRFDQRGDIPDLPKAISNASGHRRSDAQRLMDADEVVIHHVQRNRVGVVLDLLREGVGKAGKAAHVHIFAEK